VWHVQGRGAVHAGYLWGNLRETYDFEYLGVYGKIILKWVFRKYYRGVEWIDIFQDRDKWRAFVNAVANLHVP
jgi:hypothetical protein